MSKDNFSFQIGESARRKKSDYSVIDERAFARHRITKCVSMSEDSASLEEFGEVEFQMTSMGSCGERN